MNSLTAAAQSRLDAARKAGGKVTLYAGSYDAPLVLQPASGQPFVSGVEVECLGPFSKLVKAHGGPFLVTEEAKDCLFSFPVLGDGTGQGVLVKASSSSSRLDFDRCHFQGLGQGVLLQAEGGADISAVVLEKCQFTDCGQGLKVTGPNALDPVVWASWFSSCGIALDFREGGSNFTVTASGMSHCGEGVVANAGYQGTAGLTSVEDTGTVFRIGGDDAGGYGAPGVFRLSVQDARGVGVLGDVRCGGTVSLDALKSQGTVRAENKGPATLTVTLGGAAVKLPRSSTGKVVFK